MAQLVEWSLLAPEICGSKPNIYLPIVHLNRKDENKEKETGNGPSLKKESKTVSSHRRQITFCANDETAKRQNLEAIFSFLETSDRQ